MDQNTIRRKGRLTTSQKNANGKQWYKDEARSVAIAHNDLSSANGGVSELKRMQVNYDLFNNIINLKEFEYVCKPYGAKIGELPANMSNRDISSSKIKALLGMEMKRPFSWRALAVNPEATSRKEQEEFRRINEYVIAGILGPIRKQIETQVAQENAGKELSQEETQAINQQIDQELNAQTPPEVKKYMERDHQDPAEVMTHQLLEYLMQKLDIRTKFNTAFKHLSLSAKEVMYIAANNGEVDAWNVNSMDINATMSAMSPFVEDAERISVKYSMTPSEVVKRFSKDLTDKEVDKIFSKEIYFDGDEDLFRQANTEEESYQGGRKRSEYHIDVTHTLWKSLRKLVFLTYIDPETEKEKVTLVGDNYKLNEDEGDLYLEVEWLPESYETWIIGADIFVQMQPLPGQFKDIENPMNCKFPYYGVFVDDMNSVPTAPMDRLKFFQYLYNIVIYRLELLTASDKGKKVLMNINAIPDSAGINLEQWQYFFESSPFMWYNPNEEGTGYQDVNTMAKVIDLSLASDIGKYIEFAEYLRRQSGNSVGITEAVEGQAGAGDSVGNNRQNLVQTSNILEPFFDLHNTFKRNILNAIVEAGKIAYSGKGSMKLSYTLDDMSLRMLNVDMNLIENSTLGIFISNSTKAEETLQTIKTLAHAAMQSQTVELSDMLAVLRQEGMAEAEETLIVSEKRRKEEIAQAQQQEAENNKELEKLKQEGVRRLHENEKEIVVLKEEEKRKTVIAQSAIMGMSFNPDADADGDGVNDFLEIARDGVDAEIKRSQNQLDREKFEHQKEVDKEDLKIKNKAVNIKKKATS